MEMPSHKYIVGSLLSALLLGFLVYCFDPPGYLVEKTEGVVLANYPASKNRLGSEHILVSLPNGLSVMAAVDKTEFPQKVGAPVMVSIYKSIAFGRITYAAQSFIENETL